MSYIEKEKLIKADIASIENRVRHAFNQGYDLGFKDGKKRAKPQEQEPIIDKIRAEIKQYQSDYDVHGTEYDRTAWKAFNRCLQSIDKYKAKSEDKE